MIIAVNGIYPKIHSSVWIAPTATIIGDVEIGEGSSVWFNTVIRGDVFPMRIGREVNIQDNCTLHGTYKKCGVIIHDRVTIGHQVILHGCEINEGALIGMGCILMDNAVIGKRCLVGAGSLVTEGAQFEDGQFCTGSNRCREGCQHHQPDWRHHRPTNLCAPGAGLPQAG